MLYFIFFIILVLVIFSYFNKSSSDESNAEINVKNNVYISKKIMTPNEIEFFNRLVTALPEYYVFSQVSMGAILDAKSDDFKEKNRIRKTFSQKIIDYVICSHDLKVLAVIELDDRTHNIEKDEKRDNMLKMAGYKTYRFQSKNKPTIDMIKKELNL